VWDTQCEDCGAQDAHGRIDEADLNFYCADCWALETPAVRPPALDQTALGQQWECAAEQGANRCAGVCESARALQAKECELEALRQAHHAHHASQTQKYEQMLRELSSAGGELECALAAAQQMQASAQEAPEPKVVDREVEVIVCRDKIIEVEKVVRVPV